jgi:hypothetical protein
MHRHVVLFLESPPSSLGSKYQYLQVLDFKLVLAFAWTKLLCPPPSPNLPVVRIRSGLTQGLK